LNILDENREVEVEVVHPQYGELSLLNRLKLIGFVPQSMTLSHTVALSSKCNSVFQHDGITYVGLDNKSIKLINREYQLGDSLVNLGGCVECVRVYNDRVFSLVGADSGYNTVCVHDSSGELVTKWSGKSRGVYNKLTVVNDLIIVPSRTSKSLTFYSLTGKFQKSLPFSLLTGSGATAICSVGTNFVVISDTKSSRVFKLDISNGKICWESQLVSKPQGVAYQRGMVYVMNRSTTPTLWLLDSDTGNLLTSYVSTSVLYIIYMLL